ncbi:MAG: hypothetical protein ABIN91_16675 [Mucilaginibacter sp.]|uniref:hypothetical protein n=1 Tax=Mucilaginibacter sp. TaxID=1882438 RepID=UPI003265626F
MNAFSKSDLHYQNRYSWNNEKRLGLSRTTFAVNIIFNRHDGPEVLGLINRLMQRHNLSSMKSVEKMETMLINLPFEEQTHRQVGEWIMNHWNKKVPYPENARLVMAG